MLKRMKIWISILLILVLLTGCGGNASQDGWEVEGIPDADFGTVDTNQNDKNEDPNPSDNPSTDDPTTDDPSSDAPSTDDPSAKDPVADNPSTDDPTTDDPTTDDPSANDPTTDDPSDNPSADDPDEPAISGPTGNKIKMMSLNIYHGNPAAPNSREQRVQRIGGLFEEYRPAVAGLQEVRPWWVNDVEDSAPGIPDAVPDSYEFIVYYRNEKDVVQQGYGAGSREGCAIAYDTSAVTLLKEGMFWLSEYPNIESKFEEADTYRVAVWAKFKITATGEEFYFCSTHLSVEEEAQVLQVNCLLDQLAEITKKNGDAPLAICGDFNALPNSVPYVMIASEFTEPGADLGDGVTPTFPHWGAHFDDGHRIDYFFTQGEWTPIYYEVDDRVFDPDTEEKKELNFKPEKNAYGYYSDHAPVLVEYQFNS